jgi:hypothetical protein
MRGNLVPGPGKAFSVSLVLVLSLFAVIISLPRPATAQTSWIVEVVDSNGDTGWETSLALNSKGHPHIGYQDYTNATNHILKYAAWDGSLWNVTTVDSIGCSYLVGTSIAIDSQDRPWIAYFWTNPSCTEENLKIAHWNGMAWVNQTVNPPGTHAGIYPSLALDSMDRPRIVYYGDLDSRLTLSYAAWDGSSWDYDILLMTNVTSPSMPIEYSTSLRLDSMDMPRIAYAGDTNLSYIHLDGGVWGSDLVESGLMPPGPSWVSMSLDFHDFPHVSYADLANNDLRYAHWNGANWTTGALVSVGSVGTSSSIAIDSHDDPHISYAHGTNANPPPNYLYYIRKDGAIWMLPETVDATQGVGRTSSLALDSHDLPHISYQWHNDTTGRGDLRYAYMPWVDSEPPVSNILQVSPYWNGGPVQAEATDESGVANVTLWYRYSGDNSTWGAWIQFSTLSSPPWMWSFTFPGGEGYYEYYSTAVDTMGNVEPPPAVADASEGYDITPPVSTALPISPYWHTTAPITVNATATDGLSGVADVTLLYSHAPLSNASWSPWTPFGIKMSPPWSWSFPFLNGEGHYMFHTIATDNATNVEGAKTVAEAVAGYMNPPDYVLVNPQPSSPQTIGLSLPLQLSIEVRNRGGNASVASTLSFFDSLAPTTPFASFQVPPVPASGTSGPFTAAWTSPATGCSCSVSAFVDSDNNVTESNESNNMYAWTVNVVPGPVTLLVIGNPNHASTAMYVRSSTPLDLSVVDQSSTGINHTWYRIDNVTWTEYSSSFFLSGDGDHYIEWYSEDNVGNIEETSWRVLRVDDTPPATIISIGEPKYLTGGNFVKSSTPLTLSAVDGGVGSNSTFYRFWDGSWSQWRDYSTSFSLTGRDGTWYVEFLSFDYLGNRETVRNETLILDDSPPVTTISPAAPFTLTAADSGCGVNVTVYKIDGGNWTVYTGGFTLTEGAHTIFYYSIDNLGNVEQERSLAVKPATEVAVNYKPIVALMFAIVLLVAGVWSSKRRPWKGGKDRMAVVKVFMLTSMPFVMAEAATGLVSLFTGQLTIPPAIGFGTAIDVAILGTGLAVATFISMRGAQGRNPDST